MKQPLPALTPATSPSVANVGSAAQWDGVRELIGAMPIVIMYRAVRELIQQRRHRRLVLAAFRR